jgi:hypothetical protein
MPWLSTAGSPLARAIRWAMNAPSDQPSTEIRLGSTQWECSIWAISWKMNLTS